MSREHLNRFVWLAVLACCLGFSAMANDLVTVRWVKASNVQMRGEDPRLDDIAKALRKTLPYTSYQLLDQELVELTDASPVNLKEGFVVRFEGPQNNLRIVIERDRKELLNTTVNLKDDKPLIVGGFAAGEDARFMLVLKAR